MSGCNSTHHVLLEVEGLDGIQSIAIYDMTGEARILRTGPNSTKAQCVPRNGYYALLLCSRDSDSSHYTILIEGTSRATIDGPFRDPFPYIPRCILTQLTPILLAEDPTNILSVPPTHEPSLSPASSVPTIPVVSASPSSDIGPQLMQESSTSGPTSASFFRVAEICCWSPDCCCFALVHIEEVVAAGSKASKAFSGVLCANPMFVPHRQASHPCSIAHPRC